MKNLNKLETQKENKEASVRDTFHHELKLSETYRHFNSLIWQIPSYGIAIAAAVIAAANEVGKNRQAWSISASYVQAVILAFGAFLLTA